MGSGGAIHQRACRGKRENNGIGRKPDEGNPGTRRCPSATRDGATSHGRSDKKIVVQQEQHSQLQRGQAINGSGPTVTEVDDDEDRDRLDFSGRSGSQQGTAEPWDGADDIKAAQNSEEECDCEKEMSYGVECDGEGEKFMKELKEKG